MEAHMGATIKPESVAEFPTSKPMAAARDRIAAIDIGSNSVRLVVAQVLPSGGYRVLDEERENTRLAAALHETGRIAPEAQEATLLALRHFLSIAEGYGTKQIRAIATSAVRDASNGAEFCARVEKALGLRVEVITAREEARLAYLSVARAFDVAGRQIAVTDIGGGSTEIVLASSGMIDEVYATRLGAVRLTEEFALSDKVSERQLAEAQRYIDQQLKKHARKVPFVPSMLYGTGGTFMAMAAMIMSRDGQEGQPMWGYRVQLAEVHHLLMDLAQMTLERRRKVTGLNPQRADIIVAGLLVIERAMRHLRVNVVQVHTRGVRDGLLLTMIKQPHGRAASKDDRRSAVEQFAKACGTDLRHARQVARIASRLFDQLAEPLAIDAADRELIEHTAILANVGYLINFKQHHKHSYHLILNSELAGFERRELTLLANIARYHRGSPPKQKHDGYRELNPADQQRVAGLAAILRLALALDRTHQQQVSEIDCRVVNGRVEIAVTAKGDAAVDIWAASRKVDLFEKVFGKQVVIAAKGL
jgi:exopolyphosphatase/guanosine-5'-triphosphate,3'-diphosphate pyrophosphatase